ncbi:alpha/beta hydrolase fold domain-containing protein [Cryobacterium sp. Hh11]|uniref:alpha/beta hydrolase n=1 Tax=Cryobacterium sp. Hh11 TaxID=2555868 RepID=UPI001F547340|nr:alpha/beta hydrolase fold domain-containing protein [Cryobacterium sp. Hh11]
MNLTSTFTTLTRDTPETHAGPSGPELVAMFLGGITPADDPLANPLYADFAGFPRLYINVGSGEALLDDARRLHERALAAGVDSTLSQVAGMQHVFPILAGRATEADEELKRLAQWFSGRRRLTG